MPRSFGVSACYAVRVEQVHAVFADARYWQARLADADSAILDALAVEEDGRIIVATIEALRPDGLPAIIRQLHRGPLQVVRHETWSPITGGTAHGKVSVGVAGMPVSLAGNAKLVPAENGSRLTVTGTVVVNIPLVGGKLETVICDKVTEMVMAEQRFTTRWVTGKS